MIEYKTYYVSRLCLSVRSITANGCAMSSGGFGTTHIQNTTNDNRKHKR
jgi:hypothetical protein